MLPLPHPLLGPLGTQSDPLHGIRPMVPEIVLVWSGLGRLPPSPLLQASLFSGENDVELVLHLGPAEDRNPKSPGRVIQSLVSL